MTGTGGINGGVVVGTLDATKVGSYINLVESTTNAGEYTINFVNLGATSLLTDNTTTLIAVADFGATQAFTANNFLLGAAAMPTLQATPSGIGALPCHWVRW